MADEILTAAEMRAFEQAGIASGLTSGAALMESAGQGVMAATMATWPDFMASPGRALVLCGPGNNGGDGYVIARLLHHAGWTCQIAALSGANAAPEDAAAMAGMVPDPVTKTGFSAGVVADFAPDLVVDALFGTGLSRACDLDLSSADAAQLHRARVVAVDVPSGLCADSGRKLGAVLRADLTVSFERPRPGHFLGQGPEFCGDLRVVPIGLARISREIPALAAKRITATGLRMHERLLKSGGQHKFDYGHVMVFSGPPGKGGAARLAARSALRIGAGLVSLACPTTATCENAAQLNAIMVAASDGAQDAMRLLDDPRINAVCIGPGLGTGTDACDLIRAVMTAGRATVLDADALSAFASDPGALFDLLHPQTVLTPHFGEFARLFPDLAAELNGNATTGPAFSVLDAVRNAAARAGAVVLLKGAATVIADPGGRVFVNDAVYSRAAPWLATAGSGDVLAGLITGALARGIPPLDAAGIAAWLHVEAATVFGPGLIAEDIPEALPQVFRNLAASDP